jgi:hypothetical protein
LLTARTSSFFFFFQLVGAQLIIDRFLNGPLLCPLPCRPLLDGDGAIARQKWWRNLFDLGSFFRHFLPHSRRLLFMLACLIGWAK